MKTEHPAFLAVSDSEEIFNETNCPWDVRNCVESAMRRRQTTGCVYGRGQRYFWRETTPHEPSIHLEFTRGARVVERFDIPVLSWEAFCLVAEQNGKTGPEYLQLVLATGLGEQSISEMIGWLFNNESDEIRRFRQAQAEFHGEDYEVSAPEFSTHTVE